LDNDCRLIDLLSRSRMSSKARFATPWRPEHGDLISTLPIVRNPPDQSNAVKTKRTSLIVEAYS